MNKKHITDEILSTFSLPKEDRETSFMFSYIITGDEKNFISTFEKLDKSPFAVRNPENGDTLLHTAIKSRQANVCKAIFSIFEQNPIGVLAFMNAKNSLGKTVFDVLEENDEGAYDLFSNFCKKWINSIKFEASLQEKILNRNPSHLL